MKFYYDGKLVRTSKTHEYTHAIIDTNTGNAIACCSRLNLAEKRFNSEISSNLTEIDFERRCISAKLKGENRILNKVGGRTYPVNVSKVNIEKTEQCINGMLERIEYIKSNWIIVELTKVD